MGAGASVGADTNSAVADEPASKGRSSIEAGAKARIEQRFQQKWGEYFSALQRNHKLSGEVLESAKPNQAPQSETTLPNPEDLYFLPRNDFLQAGAIMKYEDAYHKLVAIETMTKDDRILYISQKWEDVDKRLPDSHGREFEIVKEFLESAEGQGVTMIWVDYSCLEPGREHNFGWLYVQLTNDPHTSSANHQVLVVPKLGRTAAQMKAKSNQAQSARSSDGEGISPAPAVDAAPPPAGGGGSGGEEEWFTDLEEVLASGWCLFEAVAATLHLCDVFLAFRTAGQEKSLFLAAGRKATVALPVTEEETSKPARAAVEAASPAHTELRLAKNQLGAYGAIMISAGATLTSLDMAENHVLARGAAALAKCPQLTRLNLALNSIGEEGAVALAGSTSIRDLNLSSNWVENQGAKALAKNQSLTRLDLSGNWVGLAGAAALAGAAPNLTSLNLSYNGLEDAAAARVAESAGLTHLDLSYNGVGLRGALALAAAPALVKLDLVDCNLGPQAARALAGGCGGPGATLTALDLRGNGAIDTAAAQRLAAAPGLERLRLPADMEFAPTAAAAAPGEVAASRRRRRSAGVRMELPPELLGEGGPPPASARDAAAAAAARRAAELPPGGLGEERAEARRRRRSRASGRKERRRRRGSLPAEVQL